MDLSHIVILLVEVKVDSRYLFLLVVEVQLSCKLVPVVDSVLNYVESITVSYTHLTLPTTPYV